MLKRLFEIIGVVSLICFSFYYTNTASDIIRKNDPIMKEIINVKDNYVNYPTNAVLNDNVIIPGINGIELDVDESYKNMKKYGSYNESLLVLKEVEPTISIKNIYDKYIKNGNTKKNLISLVFVFENYNNLEKIVEVLKLKKVKASFFIRGDLFEKKPYVLELLKEHDINILESNENEFKRILKLIEIKTDKNIKFCYSEKENNELLNMCKDNDMYTIIPSLNTNSFPYSDIKMSLKNGSIIKLNNSNQVVDEIKMIINYIRQKGYQLVTLHKIIDE